MHPERVLITGAAGFLGSHLCDRLLAEGYRVLGMDNMSTGYLGNIEHLLPNKRFSFKRHDVCNHIRVRGNIHHILHFASPASPQDYLKMPIQTLKVSSLGTHNLLGLAKVKKANVLIASTSEVYGNPTVTPQSEAYWGNVNPVGPRGVYDEAKRFQEALAMAYHQVHGLNTRIARIFNTYGPRMRVDDGRVFPAFIRQAMKGKPVTIFGDGSQTRSFCYVEDTVEAIFRLMLTDYHEPVNIGNPDEITILELAKEIVAMGGKDNEVVHQELPQDDPAQRCPDISRAKAVLDWEPSVSRETGLRKTYAYFKHMYQQGHN